VILLVVIWTAWLLHLDTGMLEWGFSAAALKDGRGENLFLHMFAHANLMHIGFNSVVLFSLSGPLLTWMGGFPASWIRYFVFFLLSGLGGAALFLALNPAGNVPMIGASGAISGLIGLAARLSDEHRGLVPLFSAEMGRRIWHFAKANLWLVLIFAIPVLLGLGGGRIAWEAHLGGFLVGIIGARLFLADPHG
jgi:membrane associated rhomboid family serine protease